MAKYIICEKCKQFVELISDTVTEGGVTYSSFICPVCKHIRKTNTSNIHYGNDGK